MAGSAVTGGAEHGVRCTSRASARSGIFVVPLIGNPFLYLLARIIIGTVVTALMVVTQEFPPHAGGGGGRDTGDRGRRGRLIA